MNVPAKKKLTKWEKNLERQKKFQLETQKRDEKRKQKAKIEREKRQALDATLGEGKAKPTVSVSPEGEITAAELQSIAMMEHIDEVEQQQNEDFFKMQQQAIKVIEEVKLRQQVVP
jgi:hypothetical protein